MDHHRARVAGDYVVPTCEVPKALDDDLSGYGLQTEIDRCCKEESS